MDSTRGRKGSLPFGCMHFISDASYSGFSEANQLTRIVDQADSQSRMFPFDAIHMQNAFMESPHSPDPPPAPAPAPGDPLLTEAEQLSMNFELANITSENYGEQNLGEGFPTGSWLQKDTAPELLGLITTFGTQFQQANHPAPRNNPFQDALLLDNQFFNPLGTPTSFSHSRGLTPANPATSAFDTAPPAPATFPPNANLGPTLTTPGLYAMHSAVYPTSPVQQQHQDQHALDTEVLAAAAVLQNGSHQRSHSMQSEHSFSVGSQHRPSNSMGPPVGHLRHQPLSEFKQDGRRLSQTQEDVDGNKTLRSWVLGDSGSQSNPRPSQPVLLQYGTDEQFNQQNTPFVPQNKKESFENLEKEHKRYMKAVQFCPSNDSTRAPSPVFDHCDLKLRTRGPPKDLKIEANGGNLDDDVEPQSAKKSTRKRKSEPAEDSTISPTADAVVTSTAKRRKSSAAPRKENLTVLEKRLNHIESEKKRRRVISVGFDNLRIIVPGLSVGGNPSRSSMLESTVSFLQDLLDGNRRLQDQLTVLP